MEKLAFDPKGIRRHGRVCTSLSHVKDIKSLYILNKLNQNNFTICQAIPIEINRLETDAYWQFQYGLHSIENYSDLIICSLNT